MFLLPEMDKGQRRAVPRQLEHFVKACSSLLPCRGISPDILTLNQCVGSAYQRLPFSIGKNSLIHRAQLPLIEGHLVHD